MRVRFQTFQSNTESWDSLFKKAAEFATAQGKRLITVSVVAHGSNIGANGVVTVWYWHGGA